MAFTSTASPTPHGDKNIKRVCNKRNCGGQFYIKLGDQFVRCPSCGQLQ